MNSGSCARTDPLCRSKDRRDYQNNNVKEVGTIPAIAKHRALTTVFFANCCLNSGGCAEQSQSQRRGFPRLKQLLRWN